MIDEVREKVKHFLKETLEVNEIGEDIKIIGIVKSSSGWVAEAEVVEKDRTLPAHRVFSKRNYVVKLSSDLDVYSYQQVKNIEDREIE